jgi:hypothetical protein
VLFSGCLPCISLLRGHVYISHLCVPSLQDHPMSWMTPDLLVWPPSSSRKNLTASQAAGGAPQPPGKVGPSPGHTPLPCLPSSPAPCYPLYMSLKFSLGSQCQCTGSPKDCSHPCVSPQDQHRTGPTVASLATQPVFPA